jgi:hypothetical protein
LKLGASNVLYTWKEVIYWAGPNSMSHPNPPQLWGLARNEEGPPPKKI